MQLSRRSSALLVAAIALIAFAAVGGASAGGSADGIYGTPTVTPQPIADNVLQAETTTVDGGAPVVPSARTIPHWHGTALNPNDGITYGFNMVGADPNACVREACSTTVQADITPLIVNLDGLTFDGTAVLQPTLDSPVFALNNYGSTPAATAAGSFPFAPALTRGPGGALSQFDGARSLQLEDATMRAQFNRTGKRSHYHVMLNPNVMPAQTINVPSTEGIIIVSGRGVLGADININWWSTQIKHLQATANPTHLPIYLTNQVLNFLDGNPFNCCVIGFHGSENPTGGTNKKIQTFAWASWLAPGFYARPAGGTDWAVQDIHPLSHEISEWADDPFINNTVQPWLTPTAPQYGCSGLLETGDPVVGIGFAMGTNAFEQGPNPNGTQSADGYYHPEDEVFMPWFMRLAPNMISEPTQSPSTNIGRYTLMGDLNPFPGFRQPATGC